jgi:excisionase family DNA binding protein
MWPARARFAVPSGSAGRRPADEPQGDLGTLKPMADDAVWLTLEEGARYVGLNVRTFTRMVRAGDAPSVFDRSRRRRVVHKRTLDFWVDQHRIKPGSLAHLDSNLPRHRRRPADGPLPEGDSPSDAASLSTNRRTPS